nr:carboxypeptidase-like regulatory domain-containing protein [Chryseobacterium sp. ISL-6]
MLILLFLTARLPAQDIVSVRGEVKDSVGNPIMGATVSIIRSNGIGIVFEKTDDRGTFTCQFQPAGELSIKISALGYRQSVVPVISSNNKPYLIILAKSVRQLKEVAIKSKRDIVLSSDTLKYNVKSFVDKSDRVIADLLGRLPGIQVDDKGAISYNGKGITNVYIDGDNLVEGRYRLATDNVPVKAVEQVEVIERDQPVKALNGYVLSNSFSLNLKLSDSAGTVTTTTGHAGAGNNAYTAGMNNLIFRKKFKSINNLKANNIGENLENENANLGAVSADYGAQVKRPQPLLSIQTAAQPGIAEKYYLMNNDNAANSNSLFKFRGDWALRVNVSRFGLKHKYVYNNNIYYFLTDNDTVRYSELQDNLFRLHHWQMQAQLERNSSSVYLRSVTSIDLPKWNRNGNLTQNEQVLRQFQPTGFLSLSNETVIIKAVGVNQVIQYGTIIQRYTSHENLIISPGIQPEIVNEGLAYRMLDQQVSTKNLFVNLAGSYKRKFKFFILSTALGAELESNSLNSGLYKTSDSTTAYLVGDSFRNALVFDHLKLYGNSSLAYVVKKGSISIASMPSLHYITFTRSGRIGPDKSPFFVPNPVIEVRKTIGRYSELELKYSGQTEFGQITDIYPGTVLVNYRQFNYNDTPLPKTAISSFATRYSYRKPLNMLFFNLNVTYSRSKANFISAYTVDGGLTRSSAVMYENSADQYSLNGNISKYVYALATSFSACTNISVQKGTGFYNGGLSPFVNYNISYSATMRKHIFTGAKLSISVKFGNFINKQEAIGAAVIRNTNRLGELQADWRHSITDRLSYILAYNSVSYHQYSHQPINNFFLDSNIRYRPKKWTSFFELHATNLLDQHTYTQINLNSNLLSVSQTPIRERTFFIKYSFSL